jgi:hypothetical protein
MERPIPLSRHDCIGIDEYVGASAAATVRGAPSTTQMVDASNTSAPMIPHTQRRAGSSGSVVG